MSVTRSTIALEHDGKTNTIKICVTNDPPTTSQSGHVASRAVYRMVNNFIIGDVAGQCVKHVEWDGRSG